MFIPKKLTALAAALAIFFSSGLASPIEDRNLLSRAPLNASEIGEDFAGPLEKRNLLDWVQPSANGEAIKWQPALDYDTDSCYNTPAISPNWQWNEGQAVNPDVLKWCRNANRLDRPQVYHRSKCNNNICGQMYDYYFETDFATTGGHKHDWEHIVIWTKNRALVGVAVSAHGGWITSPIPNPIFQVRFEGGTHLKVVYHKDGASTHAFRFANGGDEPPENHWGSWRIAGLLGWDRYPSVEFRNHLTSHGWGAAQMAIRNEGNNFPISLDGARIHNDLNLGQVDMVPGFNAWA